MSETVILSDCWCIFMYFQGKLFTLQRYEAANKTMKCISTRCSQIKSLNSEVLQVWPPHLSLLLLLLSFFLDSPQHSLQLLQLSLGVAQQHLQGAAAPVTPPTQLQPLTWLHLCPQCWSQASGRKCLLTVHGSLSICACMRVITELWHRSPVSKP